MHLKFCHRSKILRVVVTYDTVGTGKKSKNPRFSPVISASNSDTFAFIINLRLQRRKQVTFYGLKYTSATGTRHSVFRKYGVARRKDFTILNVWSKPRLTSWMIRSWSKNWDLILWQFERQKLSTERTEELTLHRCKRTVSVPLPIRPT